MSSEIVPTPRRELASMTLTPRCFKFRSPTSEALSAQEWLSRWSARFDSNKFPEGVYRELVLRGATLAEDEFAILGAWKDGACRNESGSTTDAGRPFGDGLVYFTKTWSPTAASCAYEVWLSIFRRQPALTEYLNRRKYAEFLADLCNRPYEKAGRGGITTATFGLARASYVLHVFSNGDLPIYDSNTHSGIHLLTNGCYGGTFIKKTKMDDPEWYLTIFCAVLRHLQTECGSDDLEGRRMLDKALFCYGKYFKRA